MKLSTVPLEDLREDPANARRHPEKNLAAIRESLTRFGQREPLLVRNGVVIGGNGRLRVMRELGWKKAQVVRVDDLSDEEAAALALTLNRTAELAEWDEAALGRVLRSLETVKEDLSGLFQFDAAELTRYLDTDPPKLLEPDPPDEGKQVDVPKRAEPGDVWTLGRHELRCCDWREALDVYRGKGSLLLTDPPYNVGEQVSTGELRKIRPKSFGKLAAAAWDRGFEPSGDVFGFVGADAVALVFTSHHLFGRWVELAAELFEHQSFGVWTKPNPMPSLAKRHWTGSTELVVYATRGRHVFNFPIEGHAPNVWPFQVEHGAPRHPTAKPRALMGHLIRHCSDARAVVVDPFLGGGATLLAAEETGRTCLACELAPEWVDLTIYRFEQATGSKAVKQKRSTTERRRVE